MKYITIILLPLLVSCGKMDDMINTAADGYSIRCIDGTSYILLSSDRGLAITPSVDTEGMPKGCSK